MHAIVGWAKRSVPTSLPEKITNVLISARVRQHVLLRPFIARWSRALFLWKERSMRGIVGQFGE
ncbi:hypothetical protein C7U89_28830 [Bradyrhizobium sp. WBOS4]|nr:hypothetical protein [Bradyrhizobium sp. WBOS8]MDD1586907.1 hypothetical protein [Bradyrhizobium sp. WBOS4]UUO46979.1 hypothetical protein DCM78_08645 [Bradyrhizobium sp. WBOS04]UUO60596.1 hypothetical protein DCM80_16385 [Bradyrhizobium sp. WBOS08]